MDYELGTRDVEYWDARTGKRPQPLPRTNNSIFEPIKSGLDTVWSKRPNK